LTGFLLKNEEKREAGGQGEFSVGLAARPDASPMSRHNQQRSVLLPCARNAFPPNKNPVKDFCWWDLGGVCLSVCRAVVDGSLDLAARATVLQAFLFD
jgi:hypothetical protein